MNTRYQKCRTTDSPGGGKGPESDKKVFLTQLRPQELSESLDPVTFALGVGRTSSGVCVEESHTGHWRVEEGPVVTNRTHVPVTPTCDYTRKYVGQSKNHRS